VVESPSEEEQSEKAMGGPSYGYFVTFALLRCTNPHGGHWPAPTIVFARQCHETLLA
jgi:hypothetical protein